MKMSLLPKTWPFITSFIGMLFSENTFAGRSEQAQRIYVIGMLVIDPEIAGEVVIRKNKSRPVHFIHNKTRKS